MASRPRTDGDPLWYKDAIIYEVNLKGFRDSNRDGIGDFAGLTEKLDYIQDLGATCIWLLPFYPSPLKDDGYDISDYRNVLPAFGTLADFKRFVAQAHARGLRVLTELVIDHTSDQHPWFQAARQAPRGSSKRNWYVWSDTTDRYRDARIIFTDTERSNWQWDGLAKQYFWHRFFSHQPNLNFDNRAVRRAVQNVMHHWLSLGVDALRLDAVPYLFQREGTSCENLPEVHEFLKEMRRELDKRYRERFLLAEANQWPSDVLEYFGSGDECHMAYHFPLMPRLYMALARENRHAVVDILRNTPAIPDVCQWAIFLRNHDELTLEMVTDEERDYMYREYAHDPRMKCNVGIRRRLAPLMGFNRPAIELMNNLLFTLPGTPVIYYGDEIGMSDNIYLGDRNGVRTPMQWSLDRNAGFSEADAAQLYAPLLTDPLGGWPAVTVEAQQGNPSSLLHWMRKLIALRRRHAAFSRGSFQLLEPENQKVLAYVRRYRDETVLVVSNLSRMVQPVSLDLSAWHGRIPMEMFGRTLLPPIGTAPYFLTLAPHGFYWLNLEETHALREAWRAVEIKAPASTRASVVTLEVPIAQALVGSALRRIEEALIGPYLQRQPWFGGRSRSVSRVRVIELSRMEAADDATSVWACIVLVRFENGEECTYQLPLELSTGAARTASALRPAARVIGMLACQDGEAVLSDGVASPAMSIALLAYCRSGSALAGQDGQFRFQRTNSFEELVGPLETGSLEVHTAPMEQTNTSVFLGGRLVIKAFRRLEPGINPEIEVAEHLTEAQAETATARTAGWMSYRRRDGSEFALAMVQEFLENQGDAWSWSQDYMMRLYERLLAGPRPAPGSADLVALLTDAAAEYPFLAATLGQRTAEMHRALAGSSRSFAFFPEPATAGYRRRWHDEASARLREVLMSVESTVEARPDLAPLLHEVQAKSAKLRSTYSGLKHCPLKLMISRTHGDFHLGQLLVVENDVRILDFEGRTDRPLAQRREKELPLVDVASMMRSFHYAAEVPLEEAADGRERDVVFLRSVVDAWLDLVGSSFTDSYFRTAATSPGDLTHRSAWDGAVRAIYLDKAIRELGFEIEQRPAWAHIPLRGLVRVLEAC